MARKMVSFSLIRYVFRWNDKNGEESGIIIINKRPKNEIQPKKDKSGERNGIIFYY